MIGNTMFVVRENTQLTYQILRIGVGNIRDGKYIDQSGKETKGLTAGLWIFVRGDASLNRAIRLYPGQQVSIGEYILTILDIFIDNGIGNVKLEIGV
jgi:hypothetical protein